MSPRGIPRLAIPFVARFFLLAGGLACPLVSAFPSIALYGSSLSHAPANEGLAAAGEYYFQRQSYAQAYRLWLEAWRKQPTSLTAVLRVGELKLWVEGRDESRAFLLRAWTEGHWNASARRDLKEKLASLQNLFLTDAGQSLYHQGLAKAAHGDCTSALPLFVRALSYEKAHFLIYSSKAECELSLRDLPSYFETLKQALEAYPFDGGTRTRLAESLLYAKDPARVLALLAEDPELVSSPRRRLLEALALVDSGQAQKALPKLRLLLSERAAGEEAPAVWFALGVALAETDPVEARVYFDKFRRYSGPYLGIGWDPLRLGEKATEIEKRIAAVTPGDETSD